MIIKFTTHKQEKMIFLSWSHRDPVVLEECSCKEVETANQWYNRNGMIVNQSNHQALVIGDTDYTLSFPVKDSIDIFGLNIDRKLQFGKHTSSVCRKVNNQFNVMLRLRTLITKTALVKLCFIPGASSCRIFNIAHQYGISVEREMRQN